MTLKRRISAAAAASVLCISALPASAALAADPAASSSPKTTQTQTQTAPQSLKSFSAEEAVSYMLENSLQLKAAQENIKSCELKKTADASTRKRVNESYERVSSAPGINDIDTLLLTGGYVDYADGVQITIAKRNFEETKYQLTMQLENKFYSCLNADQKVIVAQEALDNANENKRIADAKLALGTIGSIEANSFGLAVISAQNDLDDAKRDRDYLYSELKQLMSYPADQELKLSGSFERQPMNPTTLEAALAGMDKTANKLNLDASLDLQEKLLTRYRSLYTTSMYEYQAQKYTYAQAETEYNDNIGNLRLGIINSYNTMVSTYGKLDYIDKAIELSEQQADAKKTTYELGLSTASEYITAVQELDALKLQRVDAEIGAYLTSKAYEMLYHPASDAE